MQAHSPDLPKYVYLKRKAERESSRRNTHTHTHTHTHKKPTKPTRGGKEAVCMRLASQSWNAMISLGSIYVNVAASEIGSNTNQEKENGEVLCPYLELKFCLARS